MIGMGQPEFDIDVQAFFQKLNGIVLSAVKLRADAFEGRCEARERGRADAL